MTAVATTSVHCLWDVAATLGEGVLWDAVRRQIWFVDIKGRRIHRCNEDGCARQSWDAPSQIGFLAPVAGGGMVCGLEDGLYHFAENDGAFISLARIEADLPGNRFNDGHVDQSGRLWFGSMDNGEANATGALYRFDGAGTPARSMDTGYIITNGPAVCPHGATLYHTDTLAREIYAFDLTASGDIAGKRLFIRHEGSGHPDGMAVDAEGYLWVAVFGGWRIDRYDPQGRKVGEVRFPCANITKPAFGGDDLRTVFATTARKGLSDADLLGQPLAGGLFTFRAETPGLPQHALHL